METVPDYVDNDFRTSTIYNNSDCSTQLYLSEWQRALLFADNSGRSTFK